MTWVRPLAVAVCCAYPLLNHAATVVGEPRYAAIGIALVAWVLALGWLRAVVATLTAVATFAFLTWVAGRFPGLLLYTPPIVINLALCAFFARTLRAGSEPFVSRFARIERGGWLPPDLARYTRNLTCAWALFFLVMAAVSATLAMTGPLATWSLFSNLLNYLFVIILFIVEYIYRRVRYRHHPHMSPWQMVLRLRDYRLLPRSSTGVPRSH